MQTSKLIFVICACALLAGFSYLRAAESEAQKKAREALRQKMEQGNQPQPAPAPAPAAPIQPAATPPRAAAPVAPPPIAAPITASRSGDTEAQAKAREALRQKYHEGQGQQPGAPATSVPSAIAWTPGGFDNPAQAKAREALWQKMRELDASQPFVGFGGSPSFSTVTFKPIDPPPTAFSGPKSEKLAELLRKYRADQITPEEYHKQRAVVVAEP